MLKSFKRLYRYIKKLGVSTGLLYYYTLHIAKKDLNHEFKVRSNTSDVEVFESVIIGEEYKIKTFGLEPKTIIDIGANIGLTSVYFAKKYPSANIYSLEPEKENFKILEKNVENYNNIKPHNLGVWNKNCSLSLKNNNDESWSFEFEELSLDSGEGIKSLTLNQLKSDLELESIDILKIDIEGAEKKIFEKDFEEMLKATKILIIELHDRKVSGCSKVFYKAMDQYNFDQSLSGYNTILYNNNYIKKD